MRDVRLVGGKLKVVLMPKNTSEETLKALRDWDLWGPLVLCLSLSIMLSITAPPHQSAMVFTGVFVVVWAGAAIVTVNAQLLGSTISFFQSVCVLGYCIFPLNIATLVCMVLKLAHIHAIGRLFIVVVGFLWATRASVVFMSKLVPPKRKALTVYPVLLFYLFISWMLITRVSVICAMMLQTYDRACVHEWCPLPEQNSQAPRSVVMSAAEQLNALIKDMETELGIDANAPLEPKAKKGGDKAAKKEKAAQEGGDAKPKKEKGAKPAKAAPAAADQPEITKLDIRVGKIVKVWKHDTADKLYCEEIDVGEDEPRQIASGLVHHYSLEEMQDRRILVLCNLKARNLVGFKSHGMVMCAAAPLADGKEHVVFVEPPADAKVGERIVFDGLAGEPFTPAQVEKKKVLVAIGDDMKTDAEGVARWKEHAFLTSAGPCVAPGVVNAVIR
ncbi:TPA: hypothetical protein N0F65_004161 [Lagenidium giganteum]|uniref:tRNA-binding domain-containing protein n=1 Tax=Lagenidium giganteum TaxID=4803 RepID=A0AAV2ZCK1_9STRA|nr:TPA: hypothetical protein N0F65_004161 [Lagenidium giganteum]